MRALVVINPIAGKGRARTIGASVDLAKSVLSLHDYEADVRVTTGPQDAASICFNLLSDGLRTAMEVKP